MGDAMIFTVEEFHAIQACVLKSTVPVAQYVVAIKAYEKVRANTDWSTDPAFDVHKEPKPCPKS